MNTISKRRKILRRKNFVDSILIFFIIILILFGGFSLGILWNKKNQNKDDYNNYSEGELVFEEVNEDKLKEIQKTVQAEYYNQQVNTNDLEEVKGVSESKGLYVASNRGKKYYPVDCSAAKNLSQSNIIYFNSQEEAESAGYTKSSSCDF